MKSLDERLHDEGVNNIYNKLVNKEYYDVIFRNPVYNKNDIVGELDIIAIKNNTLHYYEIKLNHGKCRKHKAKEQYTRVCNTFPHMEIKGIYVPLRQGQPCRLYKN